LILYIASQQLAFYVDVLWGPICKEAYTHHCGGFVFRNGYDTYPEAMLPGAEGTYRLVNAMGQSSLDYQEAKLWAEDAVNTTTSKALWGFRSKVYNLIYGVNDLDCDQPMCSHVSPGEVPLEATRVPGLFTCDLPTDAVTEGKVIFGTCECDGRSWFNKAEHQSKLMLIMTVVLNAIYTVFYIMMATSWERSRNDCKRFANYLVLALLYSTIAVMVALVILMIPYHPWYFVVVFVASLFGCVTVGLLMSFVFFFILIARFSTSVLAWTAIHDELGELRTAMPDQPAPWQPGGTWGCFGRDVKDPGASSPMLF